MLRRKITPGTTICSFYRGFNAPIISLFYDHALYPVPVPVRITETCFLQIVAICQNMFQDKLYRELPRAVPGISLSSISGLDLTNLRASFTDNELAKVIAVYDLSMRQAHILPVVFAVITLLIACEFGWTRLGPEDRTKTKRPHGNGFSTMADMSRP